MVRGSGNDSHQQIARVAGMGLLLYWDINVTLLDVCTILVLKYCGSEDISKRSTHVNNAPFLYLFCLANAISFTDGVLIKSVFLHSTTYRQILLLGFDYFTP